MDIAQLEADLEEEFDAAATYLAMHVSSLSDPVKLQFYGLYKQATEGPCDAPKPGMFDMKGKAKWCVLAKGHTRRFDGCMRGLTWGRGGGGGLLFLFIFLLRPPFVSLFLLFFLLLFLI
jgi:acyl-CoA-binding protein